MALGLFTDVDNDNSSLLWQFISSEHQRADIFLVALFSTKDKIFHSIKNMLTLSNLQLVAYSVVFVVVSSWALIFILPLLTLSFIFSGFVVLFTGLSYTSFKLASSKYNHVVLFLNRLLRKIADSIPPSVGFVEEQNRSVKPHLIPSLELKERITALSNYIKSFSAREKRNGNLEDNFEVRLLDDNLNMPIQVIHDEDVDSERLTVGPIYSPAVLEEVIVAEPDPVKLGEISNN